MQIICVILILLTTAGRLAAQSADSDSLLIEQTVFSPPPDSLLVVDNAVVFIGNEKTKSYVLEREMMLKAGSYLTYDAMERDKNRIYNLGLFTRVEIGYIPIDPSRVRLVVVVNERWYLYPFPLVGIKDRDWKKFYLGGGVTHQNFRGRNEKLYAALTLGYDPTVILFYRNPLIDSENNYFLNAGLSWRVVRNRSLLAIETGPNFDERHLSLSLDLGKRVDLQHTLWATAAYELVRVTAYQPGRTVSADGTDAFPILGFGYAYDSRDLEEYSMYGSFLRSTITKFGAPGGTVDFIRYTLDMRRFVPLNSSVTLAGRFFGDIAAGGFVPTYSRVYLGYSERIRGNFATVYEGERQLGGSAELRFMLLKPRYVTVDFVPVREFAVWKFGIAAALFADAGTVWFRNRPFALNRFAKGYGAGLHFLLPYSLVIRTEIAFDELRRSEFILDFTASF